MTRAQRRAHLQLWRLLIVLLIALGGASLWAKSRVENVAAQLATHDAGR